MCIKSKLKKKILCQNNEVLPIPSEPELSQIHVDRNVIVKSHFKKESKPSSERGQQTAVHIKYISKT